MAHANARLTEFGRLLVVQRITELGWPPAQAAEALGVSRATAYKWLGRYRTQGRAGQADRSSRPHRCPHALPASQVRRVLVARRRHRQGPHRLAWRLGMPRSTIYGVLARHHMSRLAHTDRASGVVVRYEREHPDELVHLDVKKLGRIPQGVGHKLADWQAIGDDPPYAELTVLTACRVWRFAEEGRHASTAAAAQRALQRDPTLGWLVTLCGGGAT